MLSLIATLVLTLNTYSLDALVKHNVTLGSFEDFAEIDRVVKLQATDTSIVGYIEKVLHDKERDLLYIRDSSVKTIFVFSGDGRFLRTVSQEGAGPGEIKEEIDDIALKANGNIVILTGNFFIEFNPQGDLVKEFSFKEHHGKRLESYGNEIFAECISVYMNDEPRVTKFEDNWKISTRFGEYDPRIKIYRNYPHDFLNVCGDELWLSELYSPTITVFNLKGEPKRKYVFPQQNKKESDELWATKNFTRETEKAISKYKHRFTLMIPVDKKMIAFTMIVYPEYYLKMHAFTGEKELKLFSGYNPLNTRQDKSLLCFNWFVGHYPGGIIGTLEPGERYDIAATKYPQLKAAQLKDDDNQLLVFMRPKL